MAKRRHSGGVEQGKFCLAPPPGDIESLDGAVASLTDLDIDQLRLQWRNHLGGIAPAHLPRWLLMRALAFRIQTAALGDLDRATLRIIRQSKGESVYPSGGRPFETRGPTTQDGTGLKAGALLVREWKGKLERVTVLEKGFARNGRTYGSLSQIAKAITGASWNGHRFFGLRAARDRQVDRHTPMRMDLRAPSLGQRVLRTAAPGLATSKTALLGLRSANPTTLPRIT